jgi:hypothetical protein
MAGENDWQKYLPKGGGGGGFSGGGKFGDLATLYQAYETYRANQDAESSARALQDRINAGIQPLNLPPADETSFTGAADWETQNEADQLANAYTGNASARGLTGSSVFGNNMSGVNAGRTGAFIKNRGDLVRFRYGLGGQQYGQQIGGLGEVARLRDETARTTSGSLAETIAKLTEMLNGGGTGTGVNPPQGPPTASGGWTPGTLNKPGINPPSGTFPNQFGGGPVQGVKPLGWFDQQKYAWD